MPDSDSNGIPKTPSSPPPVYDNPLPVPTQTSEPQTNVVNSNTEPIRPSFQPNLNPEPERDRRDGRRQPSANVASHLEHLSTSFKNPHTLIVSSPSSQVEHVQLEDGDWVIPVTITDPVTPGGHCTVHHWTSGGKNATALPTDLTTENLTYVYGFEELGEWILGVKPDEDIHEAMTALVRKSSAGTGHVVTDLVEELKKTKLGEIESSVSVQLYAITVFSQQEENPFNSEESIWMWTKPNSNYFPKTGFWEETLDKVVQSGEWAAGRELRVLVRGATKIQKEAFFEHGSWTSSYPRSWDGEAPDADAWLTDVRA